jgi:DNA-binding transcriptional MerR regulator
MSGTRQRVGISELAEAFDITPRTLRYYEELGLLTPERKGAHRYYTKRDQVRLKLILRGRRLGFGLGEIREMLDLYDVDRTEVTQLREVLHKGRQRIAEVEQQIVECQRLIEELREREAELKRLLDEKIRTRGGESP